jgi:hypothetical protein
MLFGEPVGSRHGLAYLMGAVALLALSLFAFAGRARADQVYWANETSIGYSQLDGKAGGFLPDSVFAVQDPSGTAIDTANGRIYVSEKERNKIIWFDLDGAGAGVLNTSPGTVEKPSSIAIDPTTQTLYWANAGVPGSIGFARVNETGGGILANSGSTAADVEEPTRLAIDTRDFRLYWWNEMSEVFSWVTTNGLLGANLATPGLAFANPEMMGGMAIEPYSTPQEIYFLNNETEGVDKEGIFHTDPNLGGAPEEVIGAYPAEASKPQKPTGLAFDSVADKFFWANQNADEEPGNAIGTSTLFGHLRMIEAFPVAPIHSPVFASVLKEPEALVEPQISAFGATLGCSLGEWQGDHPGASVFAAPTSYGYQWRKSSTPIPGATASSYAATEDGSYTCVVTAKNAAGETESKSKPTTVTLPDPPKEPTPPKTKTTPTAPPKSTPPSKSPAAGAATLASAKPAKVKAGGTAVVDVNVSNSGETTLGSTKVCASLNKQAKKGLKAPACVTVKSVAGGKSAVAALNVKTLPTAKGTYKLTISVSGATTASLTAKVQVARSKSKK